VSLDANIHANIQTFGRCDVKTLQRQQTSAEHCCNDFVTVTIILTDCRGAQLVFDGTLSLFI
jgi:hypothetical protein